MFILFTEQTIGLKILEDQNKDINSKVVFWSFFFPFSQIKIVCIHVVIYELVQDVEIVFKCFKLSAFCFPSPMTTLQVHTQIKTKKA